MNQIKIVGALFLAVTGLARSGIVAEYLFDGNQNNTAGPGYLMSQVDGAGVYNQYSIWGETKFPPVLAKFGHLKWTHN